MNGCIAPGVSQDLYPAAAVLERLGEYRILREIGRGGMGVVYEAEHRTLRRHVALKLLTREQADNPASLQRFLREAQAAGRLHHSNIVPVFEVGAQAGLHYYAMQYIHGQNLDTVIEQLRTLKARGGTNTSFSVGQLEAARTDQERDLSRTLAHELLTGSDSCSQLDLLPPREVALMEAGPDADGGVTEADGDNACARCVAGSRQGVPPSGASAPSEAVPRQSYAAESEIRGPCEFSKVGPSWEGFFQRAARVGLQVAEALDYAHRQGVLHRDIKPSNLILDTAGTVWITDFGLAKHEADDFTHTGDIVGTLRYMAPERLRGHADARSEVYSLGLTLYELCTLRPAQTLAMGIANGSILLHRLSPTPRRLPPLEGHQANVVQLLFSHRGDLLVSRSWDGTTRFWQIATGRQVLQVEAGLPIMVGFRADDRQLVFVVGEVGFGIWDVATGGPLHILAGKGEVRSRWSVRFQPAPPHLLAATTERGVELWDVQAGTRVAEIDAPAARSAVFLPGGQELRTSSSRGVQRWAIEVPPEAGPSVVVGEAQTLLHSGCERIDVDAEGRWLAIDTGPFRASLLALDRRDKPIELPEHRHLDRVAISPDGRWLVTSTWKGRGIQLWDVAKRKHVRDLASEVGSATPAFSPDGRWLAVSDGTSYYLWEVSTWKRTHKIAREHPDGWPGPIAFSHDNRAIAAS